MNKAIIFSIIGIFIIVSVSVIFFINPKEATDDNPINKEDVVMTRNYPRYTRERSI